MRRALDLARRAADKGEVPVGAVVVRGKELLGEGWNQPISSSDPTAHAEIVALRQAAQTLGNYRLERCTLIVTLEPCPMCAGALVHSRVEEVVFGARDLRFGGVRSKFRIADSELLNHRVRVTEGLLAAESVKILQDFFEGRRIAKPREQSDYPL